MEGTKSRIIDRGGGGGAAKSMTLECGVKESSAILDGFWSGEREGEWTYVKN